MESKKLRSKRFFLSAFGFFVISLIFVASNMIEINLGSCAGARCPDCLCDCNVANPGSVTPCLSPPPTCTLTVSKTTVHEGDPVDLSWSSIDADTVVSSNFEATTISGSDTLFPASTITYELNISGTGGTGSCSSAKVSVLKPPRPQGLWIMDKPVKDIVKDAIDWAVNILAILAILMVIVGGLAYTSSAGDLQRAGFAKKIIFWALGGLAIAGISYAVIVLVEKIAMG